MSLARLDAYKPSETGMSANSRDQICVCICTFHRNEMLERLLRKIAGQETSNLFDVSVVVVDNDVAGPARDLVLGLGHELGLDITYDVESVRAIAAVRNHTLRLATGNFIAMIDDDEFPPSNWLLTMYRAIHTFDVNGVFGPVRPFFDSDKPASCIHHTAEKYLILSSRCIALIEAYVMHKSHVPLHEDVSGVSLLPTQKRAGGKRRRT